MSRWKTGALIRATHQWQMSDMYPAKGQLAWIGERRDMHTGGVAIFEIVQFPEGQRCDWCLENLMRNWEIVEDAHE